VRHFENAPQGEVKARPALEGVKVARIAQIALDCTDLERAG
jgi:hypothetical protein